jgi:hypothetical protein
MAQAAEAGARRQIGSGVVDFLGGLPRFATAPLYRHWHMRWGASDPVSFFWTLFMELGDPPMARRMLKGIKARAEGVNAP